MLVACVTSPSEPEFNNPLIPGDPNYTDPQTTITSGPAEGAVLDSHAVTFSWTGNRDEMEFRFRLNAGIWSDWAADTAVAYTYQDEGPNLFEVHGRYISLVEEKTPASRLYEINNIQGPALWLSPRYQEASQGDFRTVIIMLEEVTDVMAAKVLLTFDPAQFEILAVILYNDGRSLLTSTGGSVIGFASYDISAGTATIEAVTVAGNPAGVSGRGPIAEARFKVLAGGVLSFGAGSTLRDPDNAVISLSSMVPSRVVVN